jgi:hypothetical protein
LMRDMSQERRSCVSRSMLRYRIPLGVRRTHSRRANAKRWEFDSSRVNSATAGRAHNRDLARSNVVD